MISKATFQFLEGLKKNNARPWFQRHRADYDAARADVLNMVDHLIAAVSEFDPPMIEQHPEDCLFRIYKDARFSRDKRPYKTNFGAFISDRGRKIARAGYYVHVEPKGCMLAGGLYMPPPAELKAVRRAIDADGDVLGRIVRRTSFVKQFGAELPGDKLKTAPRDYEAGHPQIRLLRMKSFEVYSEVKDRQMQGRGFVRMAAAVFRDMRDYVQYLNRALDRFLPKRGS